MKKLIILIIPILLTSCTDNEIARHYGGTEIMNVKENQKVITVTWKEQSLWVLTEPMKETDKPRELLFEEKSSYGLVEGKVIIRESKTGIAKKEETGVTDIQINNMNAVKEWNK